MRPRCRTRSAASNTWRSPRAATTRSTPSAATASSSLRCLRLSSQPNPSAVARVRPGDRVLFGLPGMMRFALTVLGVVAFVPPALAQTDPAQLAAVRDKAQVCAACHGSEGNSTNPDYPILAGQSWRYIYIELKDFKEGRRSDP